MKKITLLIIVFCTFYNGISQSVRLKEGHNPVVKYYTEKNELSQIKERYKRLTNPDTNNWLAIHLKENITSKDLKTLKEIPLILKKRKKRKDIERILLNPVPVPSYQKLEKQQYYKADLVDLIGNSHLVKLPEMIIRNDIILLTFVVNNDKITNINVKTGIKYLDTKLREIFIKIPIKKLGLKQNDKTELYTVQIFEYREGEPLINASSLAIKSEEHILWNNPNLISNYNPEYYKKINDIEKYLFKTLSNTNSNNYISNLLKEKITAEDLKKLQELLLVSNSNIGFLLNVAEESPEENFDRNLFSKYPYLIKNNILTLYFSINVRNKITFSHIYTGDANIDKKLIEIFKSIPLEKLGLPDENKEGNYQIQLLEYKNDIPFINASSKAIPVMELITINSNLLDEYYKNINKRKKLYKDLSKPSNESKLSKYLEKKINNQDIKILKKNRLVSIRDTIYKTAIDSFNPEKDIILRNDIITYSFKISNDKIRSKKISGFQKSKTTFTNPARNLSGTSNLLTKIYEIPINKLGLPKPLKSGHYSVQLFEYKNGEPFINASSKAIKEKKAILKKCKNSKRKHSCFKKEIINHIINNISSTKIAQQDLRGKINFSVSFFIDDQGKITKLDTRAPNEIIKEEISRVVNSFNDEIIPAKKNDFPVESVFSVKSQFFINDN